MSYDIRIGVKVEGCGLYAVIAQPQLSSPTYNYRDLFVNCMSWDYDQDVWYSCAECIRRISNGILQLVMHRQNYIKYEPTNGWGTLDGAIRVLESVRRCIYDQAERIPIECLYMRW